MLWLYTLPSCESCTEAKGILDSANQAYTEILINNPLLEIGVKLLFKDGLIHVPLLVRDGVGAFMLVGETGAKQWARIISFAP